MGSTDGNLRGEKNALRHVLRERRRIAHEQNSGAAQTLRDRFLEGLPLPPTSLVATTIAVQHEIDPAPLNAALLKRGHRLCLPVITAADQPLLFRAWIPGDKLVAGRFGIPEPLETVSRVEPDVLLIPLLAFDRNGNRLGQGGGYYDRTLFMLRSQKTILAVGLGFAAQEIESVPAGTNDEPLDAVVTEADIWRKKR